MTITMPQDLDPALAQLRANARVAGVFAIGSLAHQTLSPSSDYDLVLVVRDMAPLWYVGVTTIGGRFADLIFVSADAIERIQRLAAPIPPTHELAAIVRWLEQGAILVDRDQILHRAQQHVQSQGLIDPISDQAVHGAWFAINFNLAVARRYVRSPDEWAQATADMRMAVYGHADLWFNYFTIRKLDWDGDKAAVAYLREHDPAYLALYQRFIDTTDRQAKLACYEQAAMRATEPLGGLWTDPVDQINILSPPWTWAELLGQH
ncbi:MAG: hypothetical protein JXA89_13120 [Anaerolineae bacterium]|nr:hypothetical protein [Anaerolineae bacterium]